MTVMDETPGARRAPRARTSVDGHTIEVIILSEAPTSAGLCKVRETDSREVDRTVGPTMVRHRDRLDPVNAAGRALLGKT